MKRNVIFGLSDSYKFVSDPISNNLLVEDEKGNVIRKMSDVEFVLHSKEHDKYNVPAQVIRDFIDKAQEIDLTMSFNHHDLSDEDLVKTLIPSSVSTITDCYQLEKYLKQNVKDVKRSIDNYKEYLISKYSKEQSDKTSVDKDKEDK